jgi:hypothetical protein
MATRSAIFKGRQTEPVVIQRGALITVRSAERFPADATGENRNASSVGFSKATSTMGMFLTFTQQLTREGRLPA